MTNTPAAAPQCGGNCGITRERDRQRIEARALAARAFPTGSEAEPEWTPVDAPFAADETLALAHALEAALPCRAFVLDASEASWVYLVATMSPHTWFAVREHGSAFPSSPVEHGLRVGLSSLGRYATLQEVHWSGARDEDGCWISERRHAGIEDRRLQSFVKAAQGILRKRRVSALDAVFLSETMHTGHPRSLWNVLFDADAMQATVGTFIPLGELYGVASATVSSPR